MSQSEKATFAGGCFWCMVQPFDQEPGIIQVLSGYTGGEVANPTYQQVSYGKTGHAEAVQITFDPEIYPYQKLLDLYWQQIDPTDRRGQFKDRGNQYRTSIFYHTEQQKLLAEASREALERSGRYRKPIVTPIIPAGPFYPAEDVHQNYYRKAPFDYKMYYQRSGREDFIRKHWAVKKNKKMLKTRLSERQYLVTQKKKTEPAFQNAYWNNKRQGIYVDVVSGEPLFSTTDQYDAGCGWPSFTRPLSDSRIVTETDNTLSLIRDEVRSKLGDSHLGHVFHDASVPGGMHYCINSAALRFVPKEALDSEGFGEYRHLFD
ncbi:peptide-methionine (S)-S-oxide reductase MsrA [Sporolactobacillus pectinivorans]|uniref:peptide-methionine (S)-S-oxide reductase MsrA n=1 Tax=Sporolactobacillus pectinivorans TaxID=1591408 RepID=UPI0023D80782|nr:peptide-methionine (S)-S-oxide reductase MsrA [Sporolactobacillus pectinivorans]